MKSPSSVVHQRTSHKGESRHDIPRRSTSIILGGGLRLYVSNSFLAFCEYLRRTNGMRQPH